MSSLDRRNKVCVFIDNNSLYTALHELGVKGRIDYRRLLRWLLDDREPIVVRFYVGEIRNDRGLRKKFYDLLRSLGIEVIALHEPKSSAAHAAADTLLQTKVHSLLSIDMANFCPLCESLVLVSGSSELVPTIESLKSKGQKVEVAFLEGACSDELQTTADNFRSFGTEGLRFKTDATRATHREKVFT